MSDGLDLGGAGPDDENLVIALGGKIILLAELEHNHAHIEENVRLVQAQWWRLFRNWRLVRECNQLLKAQSRLLDEAGVRI
jgi:hypothetical protein